MMKVEETCEREAHGKPWKFQCLPRRVLLYFLMLFVGCATRGHIPIQHLDKPPCDKATGTLPQLRWAGPQQPQDRDLLTKWCKSVGKVLTQSAESQAVDVPTTGLTVITWNKHESFGDLRRLLNSLDRGSPVVVFLQEVSRRSESVPLVAATGVQVPKRIGLEESNDSILALAKELNMSLVYLPSMPNGRRTHEDRGCAILSTVPISDVMGIEMPWVKQRRVAVMATLTAMNNNQPWRIRVVNVHLDTPPQRRQQAAALADFLPRDLPLLIGGDFNSWFGIHDQAVHEIDAVVPRIRECGAGPTFRVWFLTLLRLDHLFTTLPKNLRTACSVEHDRFGSDHHPVILHLLNPQ